MTTKICDDANTKYAEARWYFAIAPLSRPCFFFFFFRVAVLAIVLSPNPSYFTATAFCLSPRVLSTYVIETFPNCPLSYYCKLSTSYHFFLSFLISKNNKSFKLRFGQRLIRH
jgi:hypothetical protein